MSRALRDLLHYRQQPNPCIETGTERLMSENAICRAAPAAMWLRNIPDAIEILTTTCRVHTMLFASSRCASSSPRSHCSGSTRLKKRSLRRELAVATCTGGLEGATGGGGGKGGKAGPW